MWMTSWLGSDRALAPRAPQVHKRRDLERIVMRQDGWMDVTFYSLDS